MIIKLGAATISVNRMKIHTKPVSQRGWCRAAGMHFDMWNWSGFGFYLGIIRPRENDIEYPRCHAGYLFSDRIANEKLPSYNRYY